MAEDMKIKVKHGREGFREKVSELVEDMWDKISQHSHGGKGVPAAADLAEEAGALTFSLELPGMDAGDVEVAIEANRLVIRGEKRNEREEKSDNYIFRERSFGKFERTFALPSNADQGSTTAVFEKGVLTVSVPCNPDEEGGDVKTIEVTDAG